MQRAEDRGINPVNLHSPGRYSQSPARGAVRGVESAIGLRNRLLKRKHKKNGETKMAKIKLTFHEAVEYIWKNSKQIRDWYKTENQFDLDDYTRSEYRTSGLEAPGDIISEIVVESVRDGVIFEDENGEYWTVD